MIWFSCQGQPIKSILDDSLKPYHRLKILRYKLKSSAKIHKMPQITLREKHTYITLEYVFMQSSNLLL